MHMYAFIIPPPIIPLLPYLSLFLLLSSLNYQEHWDENGVLYHCNSPDRGQLICPSAVDSFHKPHSFPCSQLSHPRFDKHKWKLWVDEDVFTKANC